MVSFVMNLQQYSILTSSTWMSIKGTNYKYDADGSAMTYAKWATGEPANECVSVENKEYQTRDCSSTLIAMCEKPSKIKI